MQISLAGLRAGKEILLAKCGKKNIGIIMNKLRLLGYEFNTVTLLEAAAQIIDAADNHQKGLVVTPNVDHIVMLEKDPEMVRIYEDALFRFADGMPLVWLSKIINKKTLPERVTGADLLPSVCSLAAQHGKRVYLLGGNQGIAVQAAMSLKALNPDLLIAGTYCPPFGFEYDEEESNWIIKDINEKNTDILFLGVGTPKQEKWAFKHLNDLNVGPILCIGAAFDFAAGTVKRAPVCIQLLGLEWLWRLFSEPRRLWKRYILRDSRFIFLAIREVYRSCCKSNL